MNYFSFDVSGNLLWSDSEKAGFAFNSDSCYNKEFETADDDLFRMIMMDMTHFAAFIYYHNQKYKVYVLTDFSENLTGFTNTVASAFFSNIRKYRGYIYRVRFTSDNWQGLDLTKAVTQDFFKRNVRILTNVPRVLNLIDAHKLKDETRRNVDHLKELNTSFAKLLKVTELKTDTLQKKIKDLTTEPLSASNPSVLEEQRNSVIEKVNLCTKTFSQKSFERNLLHALKAYKDLDEVFNNFLGKSS